ncbi:cation:proton antiporter [Streptomyces sp. NPDC015127]|uniref:cation:proton antiporter n=1 Tax=Streptomyces sp. NPDC015127 TaxID=3364939 RepID=UPI0036FA3EFD
MPTNFDLSVHFFLQLAVILAACRLLGRLLRRLGQTQVVADMVAGFALGASLLGWLLPDVQRWLFPTTVRVGAGGDASVLGHPSLAILYVVGQLGLVLYMFTVGLGLNVPILSRHIKHSAVTSATGVTVPLVMGGALGYLLARDGGWFQDGVSGWQAALFVGSAVAITAFPMLARIIRDTGLMDKRVGVLALSCAAVDDVAAWILLAVVVAASQNSAGIAALAIGGSVVYLGVMVLLVRPALRRFARWGMPKGRGLRPEALMATLVFVLLCSWATDSIGVYSVFGAFVAGAVMPRNGFAEELRSRIEPVTIALLLPAFFVYSGLNTHLDLLLDNKVLLGFVAVLAVAFVSKGAACYLAARRVGFTRREAASVGALMNARGLMELILLNIGLQHNIITGQLYTVLALMTVVTTLAASPLYAWSQRGASPSAEGGSPASERRRSPSGRYLTEAALPSQSTHDRT